MSEWRYRWRWVGGKKRLEHASGSGPEASHMTIDTMRLLVSDHDALKQPMTAEQIVREIAKPYDNRASDILAEALAWCERNPL